MAKTIDLNPGGSNTRAVDAIHGFLPLLTGLFYLISAVASAFCSGQQEPIRRRPSRSNVVWPIVIILVTYVCETIMLFYLPLPDIMVFVDNAFYSFNSAFSWFIWLMDFNWFYVPRTSWLPLGGCTAVYITAESLLLAFGCRSAAGMNTLDVIRIFRLGALLILLSIVAIYRAIPVRPRCIDDEEVPLLQDDCARTCYGSIARGQGPDSQGQNNQTVLEHTISRIKRLAPLIWPKDRPYLLYFGISFFLVLDRFVIVLGPMQIGRITDILVNDGIFSWTDLAMTVVVNFLAFSEVSSMAQAYLWSSIEKRSYFELSTAVFDKALDLSHELDGDRHTNFDSFWELVNYGKTVQNVLRSILLKIIPISIDLLLGVGVLYIIHGAYMTLILTMVLTASIWSPREIHRKLQNKGLKLTGHMDREQHIFQDLTPSWETTLRFSRMPYERTRYFSAVAEYISPPSKLSLLFCVDFVLQSVLVMLALMGGCMLAAFQVIWRIKPIGSFIALLIYTTRFGLHLQHLETAMHDVVFGLANVDSLLNLFNQVPDVLDHASATPLRFEQGAVEFNNVHFAYRDQKKALIGISFQAPAGQTVALVGATGSGKTTILRLLLRLHDPVQGSVAVDGQDIRYSTLESLRANIGIVPQNPVLLHDTVLNNILYGNPFISEEQVHGACKAVALHDKFRSLANGYQTIIGDGDMRLSGGELQRLGLARVMVKNPKILLLDEATSSVDSRTEALMQKNFKNFCKGKTTFVIAHRLSTVAKADKIIVLRRGRVAEQGSHISLLRAKGHYHRLWSQQSKMKSSKVTAGSANPEQKEDSKTRPKVQDVGDLIDVNDSRSTTSFGPILEVSKLRRMGPSKTIMSPGIDAFKENKLGGQSQPGYTGLGCGFLERSRLKPDAPEFVPISQRIDTTAHRQTLSEQGQVKKPQFHSESQETGKENGVPNVQKMPDANDSMAEGPLEKRKDSKRKRRNGRRTSSVLRQASNGVVLAYPKKARKKAKGSDKRPFLRRERIESEPIGMGFLGATDQ